MANLKILTDAEALPLCRHDAFGISKTRKALAAGREAYWSEHRYGQAAFINAFDIALTDGLDAACRQLAALRPEKASANIAAFLAKLHPANQSARTALIRAEAEFLATFTHEAA